MNDNVAKELILSTDTAGLANDTVVIRPVDVKAPSLLLKKPQPGDSIAVAIDTWENGIVGTPRHTSLGENSFLTSLIILITVLVALNMGNCRRLIAQLPQNMRNRRHVENAFDQHTASETKTYLLMILLLCLSEGILLLAGLLTSGKLPEGVSMPVAAMALTGVSIGLYLFQLVGYWVVGYVFADKFDRGQWLLGFNSSQVVLALMIAPVALLFLIYPGWGSTLIYIGAGMYILARLLFIFKGFSIFYDNYSSLLYFILYLCTLEITPVIVAVSVSKDIVSYL